MTKHDLNIPSIRYARAIGSVTLLTIRQVAIEARLGPILQLYSSLSSVRVVRTQSRVSRVAD